MEEFKDLGIASFPVCGRPVEGGGNWNVSLGILGGKNWGDNRGGEGGYGFWTRLKVVKTIILCSNEEEKKTTIANTRERGEGTEGKIRSRDSNFLGHQGRGKMSTQEGKGNGEKG